MCTFVCIPNEDVGNKRTKIFNYIYQHDDIKKSQLIALMQKEKFDSMPNDDKEAIEDMKTIEIKNVKIKNPNNPVKLMDGVLLVFKI